jgi:hypothetical protein
VYWLPNWKDKMAESADYIRVRKHLYENLMAAVEGVIQHQDGQPTPEELQTLLLNWGAIAAHSPRALLECKKCGRLSDT